METKVEGSGAILEQNEDRELRARARGVEGVSPEDTKAELLDKTEGAARRRAEQESERREEAQAREARERSQAQQDEEARERARASQAKGAASAASVGRMQADQRHAVEDGLREQKERDARERAQKEREDAGKGLNAVDVNRSGRELDKGEFIMPRRIAQTYTEANGKFYSRETNRVVFEDKGEKLATSAVDKRTIEDMVTYARAKQWASLKLTGSAEFRREAWLQAESQGIKTQGYTPKGGDLGELEKMRQERATNSIQPVQERRLGQAAQRPVNVPAPRHDLNKDQALMGAAMKDNTREHLEAIQKQPGMASKSFQDLQTIAELRALIAEREKLSPAAERDEALARFDRLASDPGFEKRIKQENVATVEDKTIDRTQKRDTHEQSLDR